MATRAHADRRGATLMSAAAPKNEPHEQPAGRSSLPPLDALPRYDVADEATGQAFDELTALAARVCGTPAALLACRFPRPLVQIPCRLEPPRCRAGRHFVRLCHQPRRAARRARCAAGRSIQLRPARHREDGSPVLCRCASREQREPRSRRSLRPRPSSAHLFRGAAGRVVHVSPAGDRSARARSDHC